MRTRIAPTPSGLLHVGNGAAFVLAWKLARTAGGKVLLRIDDLDTERVRPAYLDDIFETLHWLGIDWDEGPKDSEDLRRHWSQCSRITRYDELIQQLQEGGDLYACDCSRTAIAQRHGNAEYDNHCRDRHIDPALPDVAWRLRLPTNVSVELRTWPLGSDRRMLLDLPDPVIRQRNGRPAYQVASLADDVDFNIDLIVRGEDLLPSTLIQLHMAHLLGMSSFNEALFLHHALLPDERGMKLSKSHGAGSLKTLREAGGKPTDIHLLADRLLQGFDIPNG